MQRWRLGRKAGGAVGGGVVPELRSEPAEVLCNFRPVPSPWASGSLLYGEVESALWFPREIGHQNSFVRSFIQQISIEQKTDYVRHSIPGDSVVRKQISSHSPEAYILVLKTNAKQINMVTSAL